MISAAKQLEIWRVPCVLHILNLIFKVFIENCNTILSPFISVINYLSRSTKYTILVRKEGIQKAPSYIPTRWTSLCDSVLILLETKDDVLRFLATVEEPFPSEDQWDQLFIIEKLCNQYKMIINFYESDSFGAFGFFFLHIDLIIDCFNELSNTVFGIAATKALDKIHQLNNDHSHFVNEICPIALLLNPIHLFHSFLLLLTSTAISNAKNAIIKRMKKMKLIK